MATILEASLAEKRVIVWTDLDVPIEDGRVTDDTRLKKAAQTLTLLREKGAEILMIGHLGRPKTKETTFSLRPVAKKLEAIIKGDVEVLADIRLPQTGLAMLENIRFWPAEERKDRNFAGKIASLGQIYINDCFATSHHAGATMLYLPEFLPSYVGPSLEKEINELSMIMQNPPRPLVAIIGGAKLETKLPAIYNLAKFSDKVLVGGKLMFEVERRALPENVVLADDDKDTKDIGPISIGVFKELISSAATIVWNGPMGVFEDSKYEIGTKEVAGSVVKSKGHRVVGGGDTIAALNKFGLLDKIDFVSAGGGAMLEFLAGKTLPGIEALKSSAS